jgi:cyclopropane fatty-acyl-phospholipid synthase-like methyltransferase
VSAAFFRTLARAAARRYATSGPYARHFAYMKLTRDPVYHHILAEGLIGPGARVLDLGCGQGLLASLYAAAHERHGTGDWPADWPAPGLRRLQGIDVSTRDIDRARSAGCADAEYTCADIRSAAFDAADAVVVLDVLHYMDYAAQDEVLRRVRAALPAAGVLLLRVADASSSMRFRITVAADYFTMGLRGLRFGRYHCRPAAEWQRRLAEAGFRVETYPMSQGSPFANVLMVARGA